MKIVTLADAVVIFCMTLVVVLGLYALPGCASVPAFDPVEEPYDPDTGAEAEPTSDTAPIVFDVPKPSSSTDTLPREDSATPIDTISPTDTTPTGFDHQTPTGENYYSSLPKGVYSPALFAESIEQVKKAHLGLWSGPYSTTCNLTSEGHGMEACQYVQKSDMSVLFCPFGISYVEAFPSCPPRDAKVSWW